MNVGVSRANITMKSKQAIACGRPRKPAARLATALSATRIKHCACATAWTNCCRS